MSLRPPILACVLLATPIPGALAAADTSPAALLAQLRAASGTSDPFSAERGRQLFTRKAADWSCSTCHTSDPRGSGRHAVTGKAIQPLAPSGNARRFTDTARTEKWFRRNCRDVLERECTAREKGDLLTWLLSLK